MRLQKCQPRLRFSESARHCPSKTSNPNNIARLRTSGAPVNGTSNL
jgi:hypothetical protein